MTKNEIADTLNEIATLLELKGENPFKVRAYQAGARTLEAVEEDQLAALIAEERLESAVTPFTGASGGGRRGCPRS